jgi:tetratricopeptide (TPR) repeat protein
MNIRMLLCLLAIGPLGSYGQNSPHLADSLARVVKAYPKKDSVRIEMLVNLADALVASNPGKAMDYTNQAQQLAEELDSPMGKALTYRQKGVIYYMQDDYVNALDYYQRALGAADDLIQNRGSALFKATLHNNIGGISMEMADYKKAVSNFTGFLGVVRKLNEPSLRREESMGLLNLGETYSRMKEYPQALRSLNEAVALAESIQDWQIAAYALASQGAVHISRKEPQVATEVFRKGLRYADLSGDKKVRIMCVGGLADALYDFGQYQESEKYAREAYQLAIDQKLPEQQRQVSQLLVYIYIALNKGKLAERYLDETLALRDSLMGDDKKQELGRMEERYTQEKKAAVESVRHAAELKQKETERNALAGGAGVLILAAGMSFAFYKRKRDADEEVKAERFNAQISDTELKVLRSQINPHFIFNALNSISNFILTRNPFEADRYLTKFASLMRSILDNSMLSEVPLARDMEALELYLQLESLRLDHSFTYKIEIDPDLDPQTTLIPPLLLQPFVENSIWHGLSSKKSDGLIVIHVQKEGDMLLCTVTDNGVGREHSARIKSLQPVKKSLGLAITKSRIDIINRLRNARGDIQLTDLSEGTRVAVSLPLMMA